MATCPACGKEYASQYINCPYCGAQRVVIQPLPPQGSGASAIGPEVGTPLGRLRWGLVVSTLGGLISQAPGANQLGSIVSLVGLVLIAVAWHGLGQSGLLGASRYGRTFWVLVLTFVLAVVVGLGGFIGVIAQGEQEASSGASVSAVAADVLAEAAMVGFAMILIILPGQIYSALSLRQLGSDLKERALNLSGAIFLASFLLTAVGALGLLVGLASGAFQSVIEPVIQGQVSSAQLSTYSFLFIGNYALFGVLSVLGTLLTLVGTFFGFRGASRGLDAIANPLPVTPM